MQFFQTILLAALALLPGAFAATAGDIVPGSYIVILKEGITTQEFSAHRAFANDLQSAALSKRDSGHAGVRHTYNFAKLKGYSGTFDDAAIKQIASRTDVAYVEADRVVTANAIVTQVSAPSWGLGRISSIARGATNYYYDSTAGAGVTAYVIDTGILTTHNEFGGRATFGYNAVAGSSNTDGNGHGTHVSGTIGGTTYGVAKKVSLVAVKVLGDDGSGTNSGVIAGIQWAATNSGGKKAVANMSLGGDYSAALNDAVAAAVSAGLTFAVAAGNSGLNAANYSPASTPSAITVGATDSTDTRASYSNYGTLLDIFAPGSYIVSSYIGSNSATATLSGTSMASPHVAGVAAYLLGIDSSLNTPALLTAKLLSLASTGLVVNPGTGSPNKLLYNGSGH